MADVVVLRPLVSGSFLFGAGLPEEYVRRFSGRILPDSSYSCASRFDSGYMLLPVYVVVSTVSVNSAMLVLSGTCYASVYSISCFLREYVDYGSRGRFSTLGTRFIPLVSDNHMFGTSPDEYMIWIFWELTSGIISVCSAPVRQWIHIRCQSMVAFGRI